MVGKPAADKAEEDMSLEQQENLQIKGTKARNVMMQKLLRNPEVMLSELMLCHK